MSSVSGIRAPSGVGGDPEPLGISALTSGSHGGMVVRVGQMWGHRFERVRCKPPSDWRSKGCLTRQNWGDALPEGYGCLGARL